MSLRNAIASCAAALTLILATPVLAQSNDGLEADLDNNQAPSGTQGLQPNTQGQDSELETTTFQDWTVQCRPAQDQAPRLCRMVQAVNANEADRTIMQVVIATPPQRGTVVTFIVPLGVFLQAGPAVKVDGAQIGQAAYVSCVRQGCVARMRLDDQALAAMRQGRKLQVTLTGQQGNSRDVSASLLGFTDAYNGLAS